MAQLLCGPAYGLQDRLHGLRQGMHLELEDIANVGAYIVTSIGAGLFIVALARWGRLPRP